MPLAVGETTLKGVTLSVLLLPRGSRAVTRVNITNNAVANEGALTMSLSAATANTQIRAGNSLSFAPTTGTNFRRKTAIVLDDVALGTSPTTVNVSSLIDNIAANERASFIVGLVPVFGVQEFSLQSQDQTVDTTDTQSGAGMESVVVRSGYTFSINCIERIADFGLTGIVKRVGLEFGLKGREVYAVLAFPDGEIHEGAAKVMNYSQPGNQNEVKRAAFELQFQGESYRYTPPATFDGTFTPGVFGGGSGAPAPSPGPSPSPGPGPSPSPSPSFDTTLTVVTTGTSVNAGGVTLTGTAGNVMSFNTLTSGASLPASMLIFVGGTQVAQVDFTSRYLGQSFSYTAGGQTYTSTFIDGNRNF